MRTLEQGWERDRLGSPGLMIRWWFFARLEGEHGRPQGPRKGVADEGFTFARGGRVATEQEATRALLDAASEAEQEYRFWRGQPSHALGERGERVPLDRVPLPS